MRQFFLLLFSLLFSTSIYAQTERATLDSCLSHYFAASERLEVKVILDYMHPKLFEMAPREIIAASMEEAFNSPEVRVRLKDGNILKVSPTQKKDQIEYVLIDYSFVMEMQMLNTEEEEKDGIVEGEEALEMEADTTEFNMDEMDTMMLNMFKMQYGEENVKYNAEKELIEIFTEKKMFGINDPSLDTWKFIEKKDNGQGLIDMIIPEKVQKELVK